jgi:hypothetical protein
VDLLEQNMRRENGDYWHIPVRPRTRPASTFAFYEILADVETELSSQDHLHVYFVPVYPE